MINHLIHNAALVQKICEETKSQLLKFEMDEGDISGVTIKLRMSPPNHNLAIVEESKVSKLQQIEEIVNKNENARVRFFWLIYFREIFIAVNHLIALAVKIHKIFASVFRRRRIRAAYFIRHNIFH